MKLSATRNLAAILLAGSWVAPAWADHDEEASNAGPTGDVADLISDLYGGDGITLDPGIVFHEAHFTADSQEALTNLSNIISANAGLVAFNSTVSSISFDIEEGVPVRSQQSLGPIVAERATTIGAGRINFGVSYTRVDYKQFNGTKLDHLQIVLEHDEQFGVPYEQDLIVLNLDLDLQQEFVAFSGTYGLTNNVDIGVTIPLVHSSGRVRSEATIIDNGGGGIHRFGGNTQAVATNSASASGIGDIAVRAKWHVTEGRSSVVDLGVVGQATFATGDERDLLGSGETSVFVGGIASGSFGKINPHLNIGYEYYIDEGDLAGLGIERSNARAAAGFDIKARDNFALATDILARWRQDGLSLYDLAIGAKWAPIGDVPLSANLVVPLNRNEGLRSDFYFTIGIEGTF
ncbi:hypothetical protein ACWPM1_12955 [Tsuneonella sp. HG249]